MTKEPNKYLPPKVRRPRHEFQLAVNQIQKGDFIVAGSWRREKETVGDLDILVPSYLDFGEAITEFETLFSYEPIRSGALKSEGIAQYFGKPLLLNLWRIPEARAYGAMLLYTTGPYDLNIMMRANAKARGWNLNQYGLWDSESKSPNYPPTQLDIGRDNGNPEADIFNLLGLQYLTPRERETWRDILLGKPKKTGTFVSVASSDGENTYQVTVEDGEAIECECKGFQFRRKCRHLAEAEAIHRGQV